MGKRIMNEEEAERWISYALLNAGLMPSNFGFRYTKRAIVLYEKLNKNVENVYHAIARENGVTRDSVERDIRTAISVAYSRGSIANLLRYLGVQFYSEPKKLSSKKFIAFVSEIFISEVKVVGDDN